MDIEIDGELPVLLDLLPQEFTSQLEVGQPIATMGFPGEISNPYAAAPIATFKEGTISALRPFSSVSPTTENTTLVQHNLGTTGGTSGSPIIDWSGFLIAVNHAGTEVLVYDHRTGQPQRVTTGALGFGIRADEVWTMVDLFEASSRASTRRVATPKRATLDSYQAFPVNWDGTTITPATKME